MYELVLIHFAACILSAAVACSQAAQVQCTGTSPAKRLPCLRHILVVCGLPPQLHSSSSSSGSGNGSGSGSGSRRNEWQMRADKEREYNRPAATAPRLLP